MMTLHPIRSVLLVFVAAATCELFPITTSATADNVSQWRFSVSLDGKHIGYHTFTLGDLGAERDLLSEARFNVKILFINAYSYSHDAKERWQGDCLQQLDARTNDNGAANVVSGRRDASRFIVANGSHTIELASCVQTFAYWNPSILSATHLLNPQTGEYVPVRVQRIGNEMIDVRGARVPAERYRLIGASSSGGPMQIDLWYGEPTSADQAGNNTPTSNQQWLALESIADGGRRLRYQMQ